MTNRFYAKGEKRAARVGELFKAIAPRYDLLNDIQSGGLHRCWKRRLIKRAQLKLGAAALDVCCGTGDIAFRLARAGAKVTGLDFSEPMLAVARRRAATVPVTASLATMTAPNFVRGDAMHLPFQDDQFHVVTVGYGLRNLADWRVGLREMVRVTSPGGRVLVLDFGKPQNPILRHLYFLYLRVMVPLFGLCFCGNASAYAYILESLHHYPAQTGVADGMRELGMEHLETHNLMGGMMSINVGVKVVAKPETD